MKELPLRNKFNYALLAATAQLTFSVSLRVPRLIGKTPRIGSSALSLRRAAWLWCKQLVIAYTPSARPDWIDSITTVRVIKCTGGYSLGDDGGRKEESEMQCVMGQRICELA